MTLTILLLMPVGGPDIPMYEADGDQVRPDIAYNWKHDEPLVVWETDWGLGLHPI
jgi:hypothetical protein